MGDRVLRVGLLDIDLGVLEELKGLIIVMLPGEAGRIEHHPHFQAALVSGDHRFDQDGIRELKHLDIERCLRTLDGLQDRCDAIVGLNNQVVDGVLEHAFDFT